VLTTVIPATQEAEIKRISVESQPWQIVLKTLSWKKKKITKKLDWWRWLKVKALSSNPSTKKKKKNPKTERNAPKSETF
jgi:hypothetical protein